jgi:hypothetical protein
MITIEMQPHGGVPRWVGESLGRTPFVVVRRGTITADAIPIGIRGRGRPRHVVRYADVQSCLKPRGHSAPSRLSPPSS